MTLQKPNLKIEKRRIAKEAAPPKKKKLKFLYLSEL